MSLTTGLAIYFLIWWLTLFVVLPFGVRSQHEVGTTPGTDPGAPVLPRMAMKLFWTTLIASLIFGACYFLYAYDFIGLDVLPGRPIRRIG